MREARVAAGIAALLIAAPAIAQNIDALRKQEAATFEKFRERIVKRDYNCPQVHAMSNRGQAARGDVFWIFCGAKGPKPGAKDVWLFEFTVSPRGQYTVVPIDR